MQNFKKIISIGAASAILCVTAIGCNASTQTPAENITSVPSATDLQKGDRTIDKPVKNSVIGLVTAVDGDVITLETMDKGKQKSGGKGDNYNPKNDNKGNQEMPINPNSETLVNSLTDSDAIPTQDAFPANAPDVNTQSGSTLAPPTENDKTMQKETTTITIGADTVITNAQSGISLTIGDITVGDMVHIDFAEDGTTIVSIQVMSTEEFTNNKPNGVPPELPTGDTSTSVETPAV